MDPHVISRYNDRDDNLQIAFYFRNPPGRILRRKWSAEWKVIPNLENWVNFFKNNETNLRCESFYDMDYETIGNLHERCKVMYPSDNSLIMCSKYEVGGVEHLRYKIMKESVVFGIEEECFWCNLEDGVRVSVQLDEGSACLNVTLQDGLVVRFMGNGDVIQKYLGRVDKNNNNKNNNNMYLYDNAEMNHELELRRVVTG